MAVFKSNAQRRLFDAVTSELKGLGYRDNLICRDYPFTDWFQPGDVRRNAPIAAFGQLPTTYESACFAVALANGRSGPDLAADFRALGATRVFEVHEDRISVWRIGRTISSEDEELIILPDRLEAVFADHAEAWRAEAVLRAKEVGTLPGQRQLDFFDLGLIPALEVQIREKLNVLLSEALEAGRKGIRQVAWQHGPSRDAETLPRHLSVPRGQGAARPGYSGFRLAYADNRFHGHPGPGGRVLRPERRDS